VSKIFEKICTLAEQINVIISKDATPIEQEINKFNWYNRVYTSKKFRRAHIEVLDRMSENNMWIMHTTIFPHINDTAPIFGFDIICTERKVSAIFHDFSPTTNHNHTSLYLFENNAKELNLPPTRELPDWAKQIFSPNIIASRTITDEEQVEKIIETVMKNLESYILFLDYDTHEIDGEENDKDLFIHAIVFMQNRYCEHQRKNPYPLKMLKNFGLTEEDATEFVEKHLFPII
jgi:hypothetical protein